MHFDVIIPARMGSTRLPGKPLQMVAGKPLVQWVHAAACRSAARRVIVATDNPEVAERVRSFGGEACLTDPAHRSGTDRIAEAAAKLELRNDRVIVNVQGDEPLMPAELINAVAGRLERTPAASMASACHAIHSAEEFRDPNVVKVVCDDQEMALYFSRAPIPHARDASPVGAPLRHIGIYAYRASFVRQFASWSATRLETTEQLEQLRVLEHGFRIVMVNTTLDVGPGIDTQTDLDNFRRQIEHEH